MLPVTPLKRGKSRPHMLWKEDRSKIPNGASWEGPPVEWSFTTMPLCCIVPYPPFPTEHKLFGAWNLSPVWHSSEYTYSIRHIIYWIQWSLVMSHIEWSCSSGIWAKETSSTVNSILGPSEDVFSHTLSLSLTSLPSFVCNGTVSWSWKNNLNKSVKRSSNPSICRA